MPWKDSQTEKYVICGQDISYNKQMMKLLCGKGPNSLES